MPERQVSRSRTRADRSTLVSGGGTLSSMPSSASVASRSIVPAMTWRPNRAPSSGLRMDRQSTAADGSPALNSSRCRSRTTTAVAPTWLASSRTGVTRPGFYWAGVRDARSLLGRGDVVVHPEEVLRVVLCLQAAQLGVLLRAAHGFDDAVLLVEVQHVDVDALPHPWRQVGDDLAGPRDVLGVVGGGVPAHREVQSEQVA